VQINFQKYISDSKSNFTSKSQFEIAGVSDVTNCLVCNPHSWCEWAWGRANLHIHRTTYTKWGWGV